jgi:fatty acid desaturase
VEDDSERSRKAVGVYDRPQSADRPRRIRTIVIAVAIVLAVGGIVLALATGWF